MLRDFEDLLSALNEAGAKYLVIGGYAVSLHAQPRATKDLDIFIKASPDNAMAVYSALIKFGAPVAGLNEKDLIEKDAFFRMGCPPTMIDILPNVVGIDFDSAWSKRVMVSINESEGITVPFISCEDLIASKLASGRPQDLADVDALRKSGK